MATQTKTAELVDSADNEQVSADAAPVKTAAKKTPVKKAPAAKTTAAAEKKTPAKKAPAAKAAATKPAAKRGAKKIVAEGDEPTEPIEGDDEEDDVVVVVADVVEGDDVKEVADDTEDDDESKKPVVDEALPTGALVISIADEEDDIPVYSSAITGATADPVKDYLKQIGKVALLNAAEEVELAMRIEAGLFAEEKLEIGRAHV